MAMVPQGWSISTLAVELGKDRRTIATAVRDLVPMERKGRVELYRLSDVLPLVMGGGKPTDFDDAKARKMAADAELAEEELARVRRETILVADVISALGPEYAALRARVLAIATKLAPRVAIETDERVCRALIERECIEALNELVGGGFLDTEAGEPEAASGPHREPVGGSVPSAIA